MHNLKENKVNIIFIVFIERDVQLFTECCIGVKNQSQPCYVTVVLDVKTPEHIRKIVEGFRFDEYITSPEKYSSDPALKHKWAYDRSEYRYVAFQQGDDQPYLHRIQMQLMSLQTSKRKLGISLGGFNYIKFKQISEMKRDFFRFSKKHLFNVGYPSFWLCDKSLLPELPLIEGFEAPNEWEWDLFMLIEILKQVESITIQEVLGIYNQHHGNATNTTISDTNKKESLKRLIKFFYYEKANLKNIYYLDTNYVRNDNK